MRRDAAATAPDADPEVVVRHDEGAPTVGVGLDRLAVGHHDNQQEPATASDTGVMIPMAVAPARASTSIASSVA